MKKDHLNDLYFLNPDAFSRFQLVCNELKHAFGKKRIKILDIGGASEYFHKFLTLNQINFELTIQDIVDLGKKPANIQVIIESAEKLRFPDAYFDVVTGIDMLEHVPSTNMKERIINEAIRVSRELIIFAGPCEEAMVTEYEEKLNAQNKLLFFKDQQWLAEHFEFGKPSKKMLNKCFLNAGLSQRTFSALPLIDWYISSLANLMPAISDSISLAKLEKLNASYNRRFDVDGQCIFDTSGRLQGYRTFFIGSKRTLKDTRDNSITVDNQIQVERYLDVLVESIFRAKDFHNLERDMIWHKLEHKRLNNELKACVEQNHILAQKINRINEKKIINRALALEKRLQKRGNK